MVNCFTVAEVKNRFQLYESFYAETLNEANEQHDERKAAIFRERLNATRAIAQSLGIELENHFNPLKGI